VYTRLSRDGLANCLSLVTHVCVDLVIITQVVLGLVRKNAVELYREVAHRQAFAVKFDLKLVDRNLD